jgi:predicted glycogen debranching enzyme
MRMNLGREVCGEESQASALEWLLANGLGGYASGTVSGRPTRGYHGLLVAAGTPAQGRVLLLAALAEELEGDSGTFELATFGWQGGAVAPQGHKLIESFRLDGTMPVWRYACGGQLVEKRIWLEPGANVTRVEYALLHGAAPVRLRVKALTDHRDHHARSFIGAFTPEVELSEGGARVLAFPGAVPLHLRMDGAAVEAGGDWYRGFDLPRERERGLGDTQDHVHAATFEVTLAPGQTVQFVASAGTQAEPDPAALARFRARESGLLSRFEATNPAIAKAAPGWVRQLVLAADQFIFMRSEGLSVIAGYHWFGDWGRDTMISLPGLALTTGRPEVAASVLRTFARFVDSGMLPNRFPDSGEAPEYNTVDATLWYFEAIRRTHALGGDDALLAELFPVLADIVAWHRRGTRYGIALDPSDGLLRAGEAGVQLTWMDARVDGREVTPRTGKPVEVNALWYAALRFMEEAAARLGKDAAEYRAMADAARTGFARFWNDATGHCFDVLDGPEGNDATLRPNQIVAIGLRDDLLMPAQRRAVVEACERWLLASCGLRSLDPRHPAYRGSYGGDATARDGVYHQGPVWGWLIGSFIAAHLGTGGSVEAARLRLEALGAQIGTQGLGTVNEIFEGDAPFAPRGCIAQAWSVAEYLRAWELVETRAAEAARMRKTTTKMERAS